MQRFLNRFQRLRGFANRYSGSTQFFRKSCYGTCPPVVPTKCFQTKRITLRANSTGLLTITMIARVASSPEDIRRCLIFLRLEPGYIAVSGNGCEDIAKEPIAKCDNLKCTCLTPRMSLLLRNVCQLVAKCCDVSGNTPVCSSLPGWSPAVMLWFWR